MTKLALKIVTVPMAHKIRVIYSMAWPGLASSAGILRNTFTPVGSFHSLYQNFGTRKMPCRGYLPLTITMNRP